MTTPLILPSLVSSVASLHLARRLAAAGIPYISFLQSNIQIDDIFQWIEGPKIGIQIEDSNLPIPKIDFLLLNQDTYPDYLHSDKEKFYFLDEHLSLPPDIDHIIVPPLFHLDGMKMMGMQVESFFVYATKMQDGYKNLWIDAAKDPDLLDLILSQAE